MFKKVCKIKFSSSKNPLKFKLTKQKTFKNFNQHFIEKISKIPAVTQTPNTVIVLYFYYFLVKKSKVKIFL